MVKKQSKLSFQVTKEKDPAWDHCVRVNPEAKDDNARLKVRCNHCDKIISNGTFRMKHHLAQTNKDVAPCKNVPNDVKQFFLQLLVKGATRKKQVMEDGYEEDDPIGQELQRREFKMKTSRSKVTSTLNTYFKQPTREQACEAICDMIYANALPFNLVKSSFFITMCNILSTFGLGFVPPSYHEVRVTFLKKKVEVLHDQLKAYRLEWKRTGCTLMSDGWTDGKSRSITNFLVNSPKGTVFIKSFDTSGIQHSGPNLFELLDKMVDEIGEENVVQVVTDGASAYVMAGEMLMAKRKKLFWSPCAAHCLDLMLTDIGELPMHAHVVENARTLTTYLYRHSWVLNEMRRNTNNRELIRAGVTRFATNYLNMKSLQMSKMGIRKMFTSTEWQKSKFAKKADGKRAQDIVLSTPRFWPSIVACLKQVIPLVKVLRLVDGDDKPCMGYIYEAVDKAKEQIAANFKNKEEKYKDVWAIIDDRWDKQLHGPLHAAGYYLNPRYQYSPTFNADGEVKKGLLDTLYRMCPERKDWKILDRELEMFQRAERLFGHPMAIENRESKQPALWWGSYGDDAPLLKRCAVRILSATCSSTGCERNWSTFQQVHSKKRNRLEAQRLNVLVYVKYNLTLEERQKKRIEKGDSYDPICLSDLESDDEWITEKEDPCLPEDISWLDVYECFEVEDINVQNEMQEEGGSSKKRKKKRGPRDLRRKELCRGDKGKRKQVVNVEDDESEDYDGDEDDEDVHEDEVVEVEEQEIENASDDDSFDALMRGP